MLDQTLQDQLSLPKAIAEIAKRKLEECGITLSEIQETALLKQFEAGHYENFDLDFSEEQEAQLSRHFGGSSRTLSLSEEDAEIYVHGLLKKVEESLHDMVPSIGAQLLAGFKKTAPQALKERASIERRYNKLITQRWGKPLHLLEMLLSICLEAGSEYNTIYRPQAVEEQDFVFEALTRLHARGCQVGFEVLTLLKYGFAEGAYARWRTLHEITVTAAFIKSKGGEVAERYLLHRFISDYKDAIDYQKHHTKLRWSALPAEEIDALRTVYDSLLQRYGDEFKNTYGWASEAIGNKKPKFADLEAEANLEHARPFYLLGNLNVHAGSKSVQFRLGAPLMGDEILVAGPSYFGLSEPGQATAWTINQLTGALLLTRPNLDRLALCVATTLLVDEIYEAFSEADKKVTAMEQDNF